MVIQLTKEKSKHLEYEFQLTKNQITENRDLLLASNTAVTQLEADLAKIKKDNLEQEENVTLLQRNLNELVNAIRKTESEKSLNQQKASFKSQNVKRINDFIEQQEERLAGLKKEIAQKTALIDEEEIIRTQLAEMLSTKSGDKEQVFKLYGSAKSDLEELQQAFQSQEKKIFELEKKLAITQNQNTFHNNQVDRLSKDHDSYNKNIQVLTGQLEAVQGDFQEINEVLEKEKHKETLRLKSLESQSNELQKLKNELVKLQRLLDSKQNEHDLLKSLVDNFEGFPQSIQFLSKSKKWDRKAPLLTDLIYCSEQYRIVVEQYLENYLNYFVVDHKTDAIKAVRLLSDTQKGKSALFYT